ncbi:hypothetical protein Mapa_004757 [Marchantia paleacea]|nr:hypothetical protein Mapa_004757 [Marchantia paleacea]
MYLLHTRRAHAGYENFSSSFHRMRSISHSLLHVIVLPKRTNARHRPTSLSKTHFDHPPQTRLSCHCHRVCLSLSKTLVLDDPKITHLMPQL